VILLTRRYRFPAAHVLSHPRLSPEENRRIYGKCANPGGHGHNYGVEVTVTGPVDERSGEILDRARLDAVVEERVLDRFGHKLLNADELFRERVPTAENLARAIYERLEKPIAEFGEARLVRVGVEETRHNFFVYGDMR
jgi:6-pyruvoyltetrahydropterin/6-carboxytetrahydropterin synthase